VNHGVEAEAVLALEGADVEVPDLFSLVVKGGKPGGLGRAIEPGNDHAVLRDRRGGSGGVVETVQVVIADLERAIPETLAAVGIETQQADGVAIPVFTGEEKLVLPDDWGTRSGSGELRRPNQGLLGQSGGERTL
jgi:hypothetical protein